MGTWERHHRCHSATNAPGAHIDNAEQLSFGFESPAAHPEVFTPLQCPGSHMAVTFFSRVCCSRPVSTAGRAVSMGCALKLIEPVSR